jgi:hypothetical protein
MLASLWWAPALTVVAAAETRAPLLPGPLREMTAARGLLRACTLVFVAALAAAPLPAAALDCPRPQRHHQVAPLSAASSSTAPTLMPATAGACSAVAAAAAPPPLPPLLLLPKVAL